MKLLSVLALLAAPLFSATVFIDCGSAEDQFAVGGFTDFTIGYPGATGDLSLRYGKFAYHVPVEPGAYLVTLKMRETGTVNGPGQRVFTVKLNGETKLDKFDLFAAHGLAATERVYVAASNGFIDIDYSHSTQRGAVVSAIQIDVISTLGSVPGAGYPEGVGMTRKIDEPQVAGAECQPGDYAEGGAGGSTTVGAPFYLCIAGGLRRFRSDPEPWGNTAVPDLGGVLQIQAAAEDQQTSPPVFYFRTFNGQMIGPFTFSGPGPLSMGLKTPVLIQPFPRAAAQ